MKVSQSELANIFGVSARSIRDWDKAGCPSFEAAQTGSEGGSSTTKKRGTNTKFYDTEKVIEWYVNREKANDDDLPINDDVVIEAKRRQQLAKATDMEAKAIITQAQAGKLMEDVVLLSDLEGYLMDFIAEHKQQMDYLPNKIAHDIDKYTTYDERLAFARKTINELAKHLIQLGEVTKFKNDDRDTEAEETED